MSFDGQNAHLRGIFFAILNLVWLNVVLAMPSRIQYELRELSSADGLLGVPSLCNGWMGEHG